MRKLLAVVLLMAGCSSTPTHDYDAIVREVLGKGLAGDMAVIEKYIPEDYIQHNPMAEDGRAGLVKFVEYLQSAPEDQRPEIRVVRTFRDGEFFFAHSEATMGGVRMAIMDVWRVGDGQLLEHWDCIQPQPELSANGRGMVDGPTEVVQRDLTGANKRLVREFAESVLSEGNLDRISEYISQEYAQHNPNLHDGRDALREYLHNTRRTATEFTYEPVRVIGEGNFVLVQAKSSLNGQQRVVYDLFRVEYGKIAEHWDTIQPVPEQSANSNGMLP